MDLPAAACGVGFPAVCAVGAAVGAVVGAAVSAAVGADGGAAVGADGGAAVGAAGAVVGLAGAAGDAQAASIPADNTSVPRKSTRRVSGAREARPNMVPPISYVSVGFNRGGEWTNRCLSLAMPSPTSSSLASCPMAHTKSNHLPDYVEAISSALSIRPRRTHGSPRMATPISISSPAMVKVGFPGASTMQEDGATPFAAKCAMSPIPPTLGDGPGPRRGGYFGQESRPDIVDVAVDGDVARHQRVGADTAHIAEHAALLIRDGQEIDEVAFG